MKVYPRIELDSPIFKTETTAMVLVIETKKRFYIIQKCNIMDDEFLWDMRLDLDYNHVEV